VSHYFPIHFNSVISTQLCTCIGVKDSPYKIYTVEHLLASLYGIGITNADIDVQGDEIPILDGSALPYVNSIGIMEQDVPKRIIKIMKKVQVVDGDKMASFIPSDHFTIQVHTQFESQAIGKQSFFYDPNSTPFSHAIAPARTFALQKDIETMKKAGLIKGGSLEHALVFDSVKLLNGPLRFPDEPARHKVLDVIGDLALCGYSIMGAFEANMPGHKLNHSLLKALFSQPHNYTIH